MNILFVHEVDWLAKVVFDIHFLSEAISLLGHKVYAIDYEDTWKRSGIFNMGNMKTKEYDGISRALPGASVCLRRPGFFRVPGLSRLSAAFSHYEEIKNTIEEKGIDIVILYSVPTNGLQTVYLARKYNIPVVFRSIDILHILVPYAPLRPLTRLLEKRVYAGVDAVLPNTPQYAEYIAGMGVPESKVKMLPFPIDTGLFNPLADSAEVRRQWGLSETDRVIVFIGTLFEFSGLDRFLQHFPEILNEVPGVKLLIVGDGPQRPLLEQIIARLNLNKQVIITGFQPYQTMPQYINLADVCINTFIISEKTMDIFPAKIVQYVACGRATVATALRGIMTLLAGESQGVVYAESFAGMAGEVISLLKSEERRQKLGQAGLDYVRRAFGYEEIARELERILEDTIKEKRNGARAKRTKG